MHRGLKKTICLGLLASVSLFFILSCTTMKGFFSWVNFLDSEDANPGAQDIKKFFAHMRPIQGNPDSHYLLACYYQERGRHNEAIEEFNKVLLIDPGYVKAYNGMGVSHDLLGDFSKAIEFYKQALKINPDMDYVHNNLGYSYLLQGNLDEAITAFNRAIEINGHDKRFHNNLGLAYAEEGRFDLALVEFKVGEDEAKAHYNIAQIYFGKGLYKEAKNHYSKAIEINPSLTVIKTGLDAASALTRIFTPNDSKKDQEKWVIPDPPVLKKEEIKKIVTAHQSPSVELGSEKPMSSGNSEIQVVERKEFMTIEQMEAKNIGHERSRPSHLPNVVIDPLDSQKTDSGDDEVFYKLQVASFRSKENANLAARSIQELGYETNILSFEDGKNNKWYRLILGPIETSGEVLTFKDKIVKEYQFNPLVLKTMVDGPKLEKISNLKQIAEKEKIPSLNGVGIEISNGNGAYRMAKKVSDYLKEKGFKVTRLTNANHFRHTETRIFYQKEYSEAADHVAEHLPVVRSKKETEKFDRPNIKVKILIGKDLIPYHKTFENGKNS